MNDARWRQIDALFDALLELPDAAREKLLDRECRDDPALRQAVERLLAVEAEAGPFLAGPGLARGSPSLGPASRVGSEELAGMRIGPYRLIRTLGYGGMGTVYLAQREDDYRQEVAIKLVRPSLLRRGARRRLRAEGQILAQLEHPNIARLYDGGTSEEGIPYLVMERVEGLPIDRFCDRHRSTLRQRLELTVQVLAAVAHTHRHLRVHCDIKPSNILVTEDGTPKLLDFGIGKLLGPAESTDLAVTSTGVRPLTPAYASPEQVLARPITTASDIYSVGVLLYELLCGMPPYAVEDLDGTELSRVIVEQEPVPPSRRARPTGLPEAPSSGPSLAALRGLTSRELEGRLRGDLDAIVLKAIRKEPEHRYPSAEAFAEDIARHLDARPVRARRGTLRYRAGRALRRLLLPPEPRRRRERWAWAGGLLSVIAVASLAVSVSRPPAPCPVPGEGIDTIWNPSRRAAVREAFLGSELAFAADTFDRVAMALDRYAQAWTSADLAVCEATLVRHERSARQLYLGRLCLDGRREELRTLVELFSRADETLVTGAVAAVDQLGDLSTCKGVQEDRGLARASPDNPRTRLHLKRIGTVVETQHLRLRITRPVDFSALRRAEAEARALGDPVALGRLLHVLGLAESYEGGDPEAGVAHLEEALRAAIAGDDRRGQTRIYAALIKVLARQMGDLERARFWSGFATASLDALPPGNDDVELELFEALGMLDWETGNYEASRSHYRRALDSAMRGGRPLDQVSALNQLGLFDEAPLLRAIEIIEAELGPDHVRLASPLMNVASRRARKGAYDEALELTERSYELRRASFGDHHPDLGFPLTLMGQILIAQDRPVEALVPLARALQALDSLGPRALIVRDAHVAAAEALDLAGRLPASLKQIREAEAALPRDVAPDHPSRLNLLRVAGDVLRRNGDLSGALERHAELLSRLDDRSRTDARSLWAVSRTLLAAGRTEEGRSLLEEALRSAHDHDRWVAAGVRTSLARTLARRNPGRALQLIGEAEGLLDPTVPLHRELLEEIENWWGAGELVSETASETVGETVGESGHPADARSARGARPLEHRAWEATGCLLQRPDSVVRTTRGRGSSSWSRSPRPRSR